jgi:hypothetical protein
VARWVSSDRSDRGRPVSRVAALPRAAALPG